MIQGTIPSLTPETSEYTTIGPQSRVSLAKTKAMRRGILSVLEKHPSDSARRVRFSSKPSFAQYGLRECIKINLLCHTALREELSTSTSPRRTSRLRVVPGVPLLVAFVSTVASEVCFLDPHLRSNENNTKSPKNKEKFLSSTYGRLRGDAGL